LYNYLIAKKLGGKFILRIEDTDKARYVKGAEEYIVETLDWLGLAPDESPQKGGNYGPYRQSERKNIYNEYVKQLINNGHAYYAFDAPEALEEMRTKRKQEGVHSPKYDQSVRMSMKNSLALSPDETQRLLKKGKNIVIRLKVPEIEQITFEDEVRGLIVFESNELDDKVLLKGDGMPTYHLANVVDDYLMKITHVIRGEEWLSSTGHHVLLYRAFGWHDNIPKFAHLPLILKPQGSGKLSKRDGAKFDFPVFPLDWSDQKENIVFAGFRELGFLPEAVLNFLAFLGWNPGSEKELFELKELEEAFDSKKITKSGAKFNYDKAKWYNQQFIIKKSNADLAALIYDKIQKKSGKKIEFKYLEEFCALMKERVMTLNEFWDEGFFFFTDSFEYDDKTISKKYKIENQIHFERLIRSFKKTKSWTASNIEHTIKSYITNNELSFGSIFPILRVFLSGVAKGPDLFSMMELLGKDETLNRMNRGLAHCVIISSKSIS